MLRELPRKQTNVGGLNRGWCAPELPSSNPNTDVLVFPVGSSVGKTLSRLSP